MNRPTLRRVPRRLHVALLGALCLGTTAAALAAGQKPVVVVATPGHQHLVDLLAYMGGISGDSMLADRAGHLLGTLLQSGEIKLREMPGIDSARPWGLVVLGGGEAPLAMAMVMPVTDLDALAPVLAGASQPTKADDGSYRFAYGASTWTAKARDGWALVSPDAIEADDLGDPAALLGEAVGGDDLVIHLRTGTLPAAEREALVSQLLSSLPQELTQSADEGAAQFAFRSHVTAHQLELLQTALLEGEETRIGIRFDRQANKILGSWVTQPQADSGLASQVAAMQPLESKLASLVGGEESIGLHVNLQLTSAQVEQLSAEMAAYRAAVLERVGTLAAADEAGKAQAETLTGKLLDLMQRTAAQGRVDLAVRTVGKVFPLTLLVGARVDGASELDQWVREVAAAAANDAGLERVEIDSQQHQGAAIHALTLTKGPDSELLDGMFRSRKLLVAVSGDYAYLAVGPKALAELKAALDASPAVAPPLRAWLRMGTVTMAMGKLVEDKTMATAISFLGFNFVQGADGPMDDRLTIQFEGVDGKLTGQLEAGDGSIRVGAVMITLGQTILGQQGAAKAGGGGRPALPFGT